MTNLTGNVADSQDDFIMLPKVDFCFKELMQNGKVRRGIIAALLNVSPDEIAETRLLPTILRQEYAEDKYGILDVLVQMKDGTQIDFEMQVAPFDYWSNRILFYWSKMYVGQINRGEDYGKLRKCIHVSILDFVHFTEDKCCYHKIGLYDFSVGKAYGDLLELHILELSKLPEEDKNESGIIRWMRFFNSESKEAFEMIAEKDEYIGEAYELLKNLSADEKKRIEYEYRQKCIRDHNSMISSAEASGRAKGEAVGEERMGKLVEKLMELGRQDEIPKVVSDKEYRQQMMNQLL